MADKIKIFDIDVRKEMLRLRIRQQEVEIRSAVKEIGASFAFPKIGNLLFEYILKNPESAFRAGVFVVNFFSNLFREKSRKPKRRNTRKK